MSNLDIFILGADLLAGHNSRVLFLSSSFVNFEAAQVVSDSCRRHIAGFRKRSSRCFFIDFGSQKTESLVVSGRVVRRSYVREHLGSGKSSSGSRDLQS